MKETIKELSGKIEKVVRNIYYHLHQHPELSFQEKETAVFISEFLTDEGIAFRSGIGGHGILARIDGRSSGKVIALRADMDALPINECNDVPFRSVNDGVMHACGHDAHVACLLGAAFLLNHLRDRFDGTVLLIFQSGEEMHPGGARLMLEDGLFDDIKPHLIIGQHVNNDLPCGHVAVGSGCIMASADEFHLVVEGKGGHGAMPHRLNDTVLAASQIVVALQQVVSRRTDPFHPTVLTVGKFIADGATNIIPDRVFLSGTLRCMDEEERLSAKRLIRVICERTAEAYGCLCEADVKEGYPAVFNDEEVTSRARRYLAELLGEDAVEPIEKRMTAEDFGFFSAVLPATFFRLGVAGAENRGAGGQHTPTFLIDEGALRIGVETMSFLALRFLDAG